MLRSKLALLPCPFESFVLYCLGGGFGAGPRLANELRRAKPAEFVVAKNDRVKSFYWPNKPFNALGRPSTKTGAVSEKFATTV